MADLITDIIHLLAIPSIATSFFLLILTVSIKLKTPGFTFLRASLFGRPILQVDRKDGNTDFVTASYGAGTIKSGHYGMYIVDPEGVKREMTSGAQMHRCVDSIGTTLSEKVVDIVRGLKKIGFKDYDDVHKYLNLMVKCNNVRKAMVCSSTTVSMSKKIIPRKVQCGFIDYGKVEEKDGKKVRVFLKVCPKCGSELSRVDIPCGYDGPGRPFSYKKGNSEVTALVCPECGSNKVEHAHIDINTPLFKTAGTADYEQFFKYNFNPDRVNVIVKREVKNEMSKEKSFPIKFVAIGLMVLLVCAGIGLMFVFAGPVLTKQAAVAAAESARSTIIPDLGNMIS